MGTEAKSLKIRKEYNQHPEYAQRALESGALFNGRNRDRAFGVRLRTHRRAMLRVLTGSPSIRTLASDYWKVEAHQKQKTAPLLDVVSWAAELHADTKMRAFTDVTMPVTGRMQSSQPNVQRWDRESNPLAEAFRTTRAELIASGVDPFTAMPETITRMFTEPVADAPDGFAEPINLIVSMPRAPIPVDATIDYAALDDAAGYTVIAASIEVGVLLLAGKRWRVCDLALTPLDVPLIDSRAKGAAVLIERYNAAIKS